MKKIEALTIYNLNANLEKQIEEDKKYLENILSKKQVKKIEKDLEKVEKMMEYNFAVVFMENNKPIIKVIY